MTDNEVIKALEERIKELKEDYKRLQLLGAPMDCFEESHTDNIRVLSNALDLINRQKAEIERLTAQRDKAVKDFTEFARTAFENPFACKYCVHSVENGRACLWKLEHEDEKESCLGRYFEYRKEMVGEG